MLVLVSFSGRHLADNRRNAPSLVYSQTAYTLLAVCNTVCNVYAVWLYTRLTVCIATVYSLLVHPTAL